MDGKKFSVFENYELPPFHPNCRCEVVPLGEKDAITWTPHSPHGEYIPVSVTDAIDFLDAYYSGKLSLGLYDKDQTAEEVLKYLKEHGVNYVDKSGSNKGSGNAYSQSGLDYIKSWEKCSLTSYDVVPGTGDWTIGWGRKLQQYNGQKNNPNITITQQQADEWFQEDIQKMLDTTFTTFLKDNNITLTTYQFDAMLSFTFNHGEYSWGLGDNAKTTMKNFLIAGDYSEEATRKAFKHYIDQIDSAQSGNIKRRNDEIEMFLYGTYNYHK